MDFQQCGASHADLAGVFISHRSNRLFIQQMRRFFNTDFHKIVLARINTISLIFASAFVHSERFFCRGAIRLIPFLVSLLDLREILWPRLGICVRQRVTISICEVDCSANGAAKRQKGAKWALKLFVI